MIHKKTCLSCTLMLPRTRFDNSFLLSVQSVNRKIKKKNILWDYMLYTWNHIIHQYIINGDKRFNIAEYCQQTVIHNRLSDHLIFRFTAHIKTGSEELDSAEFMLIILNNWLLIRDSSHGIKEGLFNLRTTTSSLTQIILPARCMLVSNNIYTS